MTDTGTPRHVEIKDGDETVAAAEVTTSQEAGGTAQSIAARGARAYRPWQAGEPGRCRDGSARGTGERPLAGHRPAR